LGTGPRCRVPLGGAGEARSLSAPSPSRGNNGAGPQRPRRPPRATSRCARGRAPRPAPRPGPGPAAAPAPAPAPPGPPGARAHLVTGPPPVSPLLCRTRPEKPPAPRRPHGKLHLGGAGAGRGRGRGAPAPARTRDRRRHPPARPSVCLGDAPRSPPPPPSAPRTPAMPMGRRGPRGGPSRTPTSKAQGEHAGQTQGRARRGLGTHVCGRGWWGKRGHTHSDTWEHRAHVRNTANSLKTEMCVSNSLGRTHAQTDTRGHTQPGAQAWTHKRARATRRCTEAQNTPTEPASAAHWPQVTLHFPHSV
jgi:hypothetical protein